MHGRLLTYTMGQLYVTKQNNKQHVYVFYHIKHIVLNNLNT